ncbi:MAG: dTDP-glucose 4,6-dehydratase [Candidatus Buchananbacteria bacterium CG10_big_fil_rev_8_21_14_0_10_42_9]|uniref:dTDP-glucose 4,6-dehydratase n=1 Tax=Candidatus Buchananbacteria bacterium CG10_big_fil_rev_8_21_14_0_10_42_9 TaxID=1974526 RepID=A0A2H0W2K9_9BACT|nr:MAG: dTDP-glucose 4,6-dehydratase [Candidatus Buchananbacteria bacterium CG10_big_fil_rev_8_21_14_0_10_42_9]
MKLLVTGGAGFIGSNFILYWMAKYPKDQIVNLDALTYAGNLENLKSVEGSKHYSFVKGNICDAKIVEKVMNGIDVLVHFAAESHVDRSITGPQVFLQTNVIGTQVLLAAALKHKVKRFHHISTDEVFGALDLDSKDKFNEESLYRPSSAYSASKASSDHLVRAYHVTNGLPITITNCSNNLGPYQFPEKFIALAITNALEDKKIPIYGDGLYMRDWIYVTDHCRAVDLALQKGKAGETYCVGGMDEGVSNIEVVKTILKQLGKSEDLIEFVKDRPGHDRRYAIDWSKASTELGYKPQESFETAISKTIQWYQANQNWWQKVKSGDYQKYYQGQYGN